MSDKLTEISTRHQVFIERLKAGTANKYIKELEALDRDIFNIIASQDFDSLDDLSRTKLKSIQSEIKKIQKEAQEKISKDIEKDLKELANSEKDFERKSLLSAVKSNESIKRVNNDLSYVSALQLPITVNGLVYADYYKDWSTSKIQQVDALINNGWKAGWTLKEFKDNYFGNKRLNVKGLTTKQKFDAETFLSTAIQHVAGVARQNVWEANKDILKGWKFTATLDNRTSDTCKSLDGEIFEVGDYEYNPPVHYRCRSSQTAIVKDEFLVEIEDPTRSARSGETGKSINVSADLNYYEYLQTQSKEFQIQALGKSKQAILERRGATWFKKNNVNKYFKPLTLQQLKELDDIQING